MAWENLILEQYAAYPGIACLTINRPKALNALNKKAIGELEEAVDQIAATPEIRVLIITGAGKRGFVAGADIDEQRGLTVESGYELSRRGQLLYNKIDTMEKVVIAAINGYALGGGCELAMACDIRIASPTAKMGTPEATIGTVPGYGGTQRLPRLVGLGRAKEIVFTGKHVEAQRAYEIGLVNQVVEDPDDLMPTCIKLAQSIVKNSFYSLKIAKKCMNEGIGMDLNRGLEHEAALFCTIFSKPDAEEGLTAFVEKRAPKFE